MGADNFDPACKLPAISISVHALTSLSETVKYQLRCHIQQAAALHRVHTFSPVPPSLLYSIDGAFDPFSVMATSSCWIQ